VSGDVVNFANASGAVQAYLTLDPLS